MPYGSRMFTLTPQVRVLFRQLALAATLLSALSVLGHTLLGVIVAGLTDAVPVLAVCLLLLAVAPLAAGLLRRSEPMLIPGFVMCNLGSVALLPELPRAMLVHGARTGTLLLSLLLYVLACMRWCDRDTPQTLDYEERFSPVMVRVARLVEWRALTATALLALPLAAIGVVGETEAGTQGHALTVFSSLLVTFLWSVGVYLFLIAPSIAPVADARDSHGPWLTRPVPRRLLLRAALLGPVALLAAGVLWWLALRAA